ncbi:WD40 repeat domain-containing serine/threonine protein kinase [Amycolatopsis magusensis]|uniref:WD40 repeat domain-containing serine/threonine protein kinase n=1 Tax=Amycolatopsis magusensis TaxID=882444 RepID=UPI0037965E83
MQEFRLVANRYRLDRLSGRGGMGAVWRATDELIGRAVAVKELRPPGGLDAEERALLNRRALREVRTAGRIDHPGVIAIHDILPATADDDAIYIVMELVDAPTLADVLERGALPEARVRVLGQRILAALDAAHRLGVVHRDVKPGNIMVLPGDQVKLIDFGIAHTTDDTRLTRDGIMGSTAYMAPELFQGEEPTPASDLWSAGATLCHAITGQPPFSRESTAATVHAILYAALPPLNCSASLANVVSGLLTRDAGKRMSAGKALELLSPAIAPTIPHTTVKESPHRLYWAIAAIGLVCVLALSALAMDWGPATPGATSATVAVKPVGEVLAGTTGTRAIVLAPDGRTLVTIGAEGPVRLWDVSDPADPVVLGEPLATASGRYSAAFSRDGRTLAVAGGDSVQLWNSASGVPATPIGSPIAGEGIGAVALSADGRLLATADSAGRLRLWDPAAPAAPVAEAIVLAEAPESMVFSEDGQSLVTATVTDEVQSWDLTYPARILPMIESLADRSGIRINQAVLSPAGDTVATVGADDRVNLWRISALTEPPASFSTTPLYGGILTEPLRFGPDGDVLTVTNTAEGVELWDVADPAKPVELGLAGRADVPGDRADFALPGPGKQLLVTASADHGVRLWRLVGT